MVDLRKEQVVVTPDRNRVIRYKRDMVGNDLTCVLRWCDTHNEPVWVYDDASYECPRDRITEVHSDDHALVDGPWETAQSDEGVGHGQ